MGIRGEEVRSCLEFPTWKEPSSREDNRVLFFGPRITCVVEGNNVVTVLWRTKDGWKSDLDTGEYGGRFKRND